MKNNYKILKLNNEPYDFLIVAISCENPLNDIDEIGEHIQMPKATLLFDLTLINGIKKNRYIKCDYERNRDYLQLCSIVEVIDDVIKELSQAFFISHYEYVENSVISNSLKFLLKNGMI